MDDPVLNPQPNPAAEALRSNARDLGQRADAGSAQLSAERQQEFERRNAERAADEARMGAAEKSLQGAADKGPEKVAMPDPHLGPMLDPQQTQNFAFAILGMSLIGAAAGRNHFDLAMASMDGMLKGMREGAEEQFEEKRREFTREFNLAVGKQREADRVYERILKSKEMSLNMQARMIQSHASAHKDWDMEAKARAKDFDGMYTRMHQSLEAADKLEQQGKQFQLSLDKFSEQKRHDLAMEKKKEPAGGGDTGNQGMSTRYESDPDYKKRVDFWAQYVKDGNALPPRFAQSGAGKAMYSDIVSAVPTMGSGDSREMRAGQVELAGQKSQARALGTRSAAIEQAASEAREMSEIVRATSREFKRTDFQPVNKVLAAYEKNTGGVEVRRLGAAINSYVNAYARAVNPSGVPTVADKEHAREILSTADSQDQLDGILQILDREMTAAQHSPQNVKRELHNEITGRTGGGKPAGGAPAPGAVEDGYRFKGGDPGKSESWERVQ